MIICHFFLLLSNSSRQFFLIAAVSAYTCRFENFRPIWIMCISIVYSTYVLKNSENIISKTKLWFMLNLFLICKYPYLWFHLQIQTWMFVLLQGKLFFCGTQLQMPVEWHRFLFIFLHDYSHKSYGNKYFNMTNESSIFIFDLHLNMFYREACRYILNFMKMFKLNLNSWLFLIFFSLHNK